MIPERYTYWTAPVLLIAIALIQISLAVFTDLDPWKGGGFGLFATFDSSRSRQISFHGLSADGQLLRIQYNPKDFEFSGVLTRQSARRLRVLPKRRNLRELAEKLLAREFVFVGSREATFMKWIGETELTRGRLTSGDLIKPGENIVKIRRKQSRSDQSRRPVKLVGVRVALWRLDYDPETYALTWSPLGQSVKAGEWRE